MNRTYKFLLPLLIAVVALCTASCDEDTFDDPVIVGSWALIEAGGVPIYEYDADYYNFHSDGTGEYQYYDAYYDQWVYEPFYWEIEGINMLYIRYHNAYMGDARCYFRYDGAYLYFSEYPDFSFCNVYVPS